LGTKARKVQREGNNDPNITDEKASTYYEKCDSFKEKGIDCVGKIFCNNLKEKMEECVKKSHFRSDCIEVEREYKRCSTHYYALMNHLQLRENVINKNN
jgi:hypothetical protein